MGNLTYNNDEAFHSGLYRPSLTSSSSQTDVSYSCGSCGYALNLSSSNRNTSTIGSKYGKSIRRGVISFFYVDDSRFTQVDEVQCLPHISRRSWGFFRSRTKLLCRKCGNHIGVGYDGFNPSNESDSTSSGREVSKLKNYDIRIRALQPSSSSEEFGVFA